jgi:hypothetical protein
LLKRSDKRNQKETPMTQETIQEQVAARAIKDPGFRQALLSDPRTVLAREYNVHLPKHVAVRVLEEAPNTLTLVLPAREEAVLELTEADLRGVSGGSGRSCGEEIPQAR